MGFVFLFVCNTVFNRFNINRFNEKKIRQPFIFLVRTSGLLFICRTALVRPIVLIVKLYFLMLWMMVLLLLLLFFQFNSSCFPYRFALFFFFMSSFFFLL